jgi:hypothetical protein
VEYLLLFVAVVASVALAAVIARTALACTIHLMHSGLPFVFHWRPVIFTAALFWCWYLAPAIAESRAATTVIRFVSIAGPVR